MRINVRFQENEEPIRFGFENVQTLTETDYNKLKNKPSINSVVLQGALTAEDLGLGQVYYDTKANWDAQRFLIAERRVVYIYSDYDYVEDEAGNRIAVAGVKIGDGTTYLIDLPFVGDATTKLIVEHLADSTVHITAAEREFWNNKISAFFRDENPENLILSKTEYVNGNGILVSTI